MPPVSPALLTSAVHGLWGGLVVLGNAPCSFSGDVTALQIEGIPAEDTWGLYGGSDSDDNSGIFKCLLLSRRLLPEEQALLAST